LPRAAGFRVTSGARSAGLDDSLRRGGASSIRGGHAFPPAANEIHEPGKTTPIGIVPWLLSVLFGPALIQAQASPGIAPTQAGIETDLVTRKPSGLPGPHLMQ
jgi:hypothetical protein